MPAPPTPTRCRRRPLPRPVAATRRSSPPARPRSSSAAIREPRPAAPARPRARPIAASRVRVGEQLGDLARAARAPSARASGITTAAPRVRHPARVRGLVVGRRVRIGHEDRRAAVRGDLEHRAARARDARGRPPAAPRRSPVEVLAQVVAARRRARVAQRRRSRARPRRAGRGTGAPANASTAAWLIERAPSEPPNTSTQRLARGRARSARARRARSVAGGGTGRPVTR